MKEIDIAVQYKAGGWKFQARKALLKSSQKSTINVKIFLAAMSLSKKHLQIQDFTCLRHALLSISATTHLLGVLYETNGHISVRGE